MRIKIVKVTLLDDTHRHLSYRENENPVQVINAQIGHGNYRCFEVLEPVAQEPRPEAKYVIRYSEEDADD